MSDAVTTLSIPAFPTLKSGKVREVFDLGAALLFVATDRISAFDSILPTPIPDKGRVLTQMSLFWFDFLREVVPNHFITADVAAYHPALAPYAAQLAGRAMVVKKAGVLPVECVVRGYLAGSGWSEYQRQGTVCGERLPAGLREASALPAPIFTPSTKAVSGHDENISFAQMAALVGDATAGRLRDCSIQLYIRAQAHARTRGIIIADTKFEFGLVDGTLTLVDEVLTPDSSRFWPADQYAPGQAQPSYDKQFVRDYLLTSGWDKEPPAPPLPAAVVAKTRANYLQALALLTAAR
ncbi:MAG: phosphoribosylaminoimidazolesuccinocarboxamide synthase [bacterium]|nr:phosphoribosylaminoimidazolesuccinocarboxamide synthase [bacterium]